MNPLRDLRVAVGFLTRIPVGDVSGGDPASVRLADAAPWFPVVGAAIGALHGAAWWGLSDVVSPLAAAALATGVALLITGAFHHDGLADVADAFGGGWTVEQRFEILKDSRLGTYGTSALAVALIVEVATVASFGSDDGFRSLVAAHAIGRTMALLAMLGPVAGDGLGASYTRDLSALSVIIGAAVGVAIAAVVSPVLAFGPLVAAAAAAALTVALAVRKIGGVTGDVLGAITVLAGLAWLVVTSALV